MSTPISYNPPARARLPEMPPVTRRHVVYVPGYDPHAESRARMLFVREFIRYAKRFGLTERVITKSVRLPESLGTTWEVTAGTSDWTTRTTYDVLTWDDIVRSDFARPVALRIVLLLVGFVHSLATGVMVRFFRLNWKFGGVILYPLVMIALGAGLSLGAGAAFAMILAALGGLPAWASPFVTIGVALALFAAATPLFERWFVWHLLHDWVFNWQHGNGWRADYEARVDRFAGQLAEIAATSPADEIVVVGHSSGSVMAVELVARAIERNPSLGATGPAIVLLTLGSCVPLVALNPNARRCHDGITRLLTSPYVLWVEYQAPQDWLNFAGFNPVRDLRLPVAERECTNPVIRSARFRDIVSEKTYRDILFRPFRMHFQFLMANERAGAYDYFMIVAGPVRLASRVEEDSSASLPTSLQGANTEPDPGEIAAGIDPLSRDLEGSKPSRQRPA